MARNVLLSGPPEIVVRILIECTTFLELISVISTCRRVHSLWLANISTILWHVGRNSLPAFEYALLAVRATDLVKNAVREGRTPPSRFPIRDLWSYPKQAQLSELKDVLDFQHMVKCVEYMCVTSEEWGCFPNAGARHIPEEDFTRIKSSSEQRLWSERFYRAIYRVLFAGAVFYTTYNKPFSSSISRPEGVPRECLRKFDAARDPAGSASWDVHELIFPPESRQYLQRFPVYDLSATQDQERLIFSDFADWLVEDGKRLAEENRCPTWNYLDSSQVSGVWETMAILSAYQHLMALEPKFADGDGIFRHGHGHSRTLEDPPDEAFSDVNWRPTKQVIPGETRNVTVVLFGAFGLEDISMPLDVADASEKQLLVANPSHLLKGTDAILDNEGSPRNVDIYTIQAHMFCTSGLPNHNDDHEMCPLDFKLFKFVLRTQFDLQFQTTTFDHFDRYRFWEAFVKNATVFQPAGSKYTQYGFEVLELYRPRRLSFKRISHYLNE